MFGRERPDVLVIGAGPVGLFAALSLARRGVPVQIVDKEWRTGAHSYALALHARSLELLGEVGLRDRILARAQRIRTLAVYDGRERRAEAALPEDRVGVPFLAVVRQNVLEDLLEEALRAEGVRVRWEHEASEIEPADDHVSVRLDRLDTESLGYGVAHAERVIAKTTRTPFRFVVGADGYDSDVRRALGIPFDDLGRTQHFAVFECRTDADAGHEVRVVLAGDTTNVLWPLGGGYCRWSFELDAFEAAGATRTKDRFIIDQEPGEGELTEEHLRRLLAARAPWFEAHVEEIAWSHVVRFERRLARSFGQGRVWLAGDAAHMTGPAGVQSMNVGLREAYDLAAVLAAILREGDAPGRLAAYDLDRRAEWRHLLGLEGGFEPGPAEGDEPGAWIRRQSTRLLPCLPATGPDLERLARLLGLAPVHLAV